MKLIYTATKIPVQIGDVIKSDDAASMTVISFSEPHKPSASGKVEVLKEGLTRNSNYYVSVIGAEWVDREDREDRED